MGPLMLSLPIPIPIPLPPKVLIPTNFNPTTNIRHLPLRHPKPTLCQPLPHHPNRTLRYHHITFRMTFPPVANNLLTCNGEGGNGRRGREGREEGIVI